MNTIASTLLMIRPASFGFNDETAVTNVFQNKLSGNAKDIQEAALTEFDNFVSIVRKKDIDIVVVDDTAVPAKPDAIFPNNWFCSLPGGILVVFPMHAVSRRLEKRDDILQMLVNNYAVKDVHDWSEYEAEHLFLEGTGSMIIDHGHKFIYACISPRTHKTVLEKFGAAHGYKALAFRAKDEQGTDIYHTNVIMHLGEDYAVVCMECIPNETEKIALSQLLISTGHEIIPVTLEQVHAFAGNMLQVRNKKDKRYTILSRTAYNSLTNTQKDALEHHTTLLPVAIDTIETVSGGGVRCMMAEIFLEKK